MPETAKSETIKPKSATAVIVLADGSVLWGNGIGAEGQAVGEICFNTAMTGYQEILTDPSYAGEIITFTFPHIGNVGANAEDIESLTPACRGLIVREDVTTDSNWRANSSFANWLVSHNIPGICGIDTRALTQRIRDSGAPNGIICHNPKGEFDIAALKKEAAAWPGLEGMDLAKEVSCTHSYSWDETLWQMGSGHGQQAHPQYHVVAMDFGAKRNILRCLASAGCKVTVVPGNTAAEDILALKPDGVFLSNGPGDPAATGVYAVPTIKTLLDKRIPIFGICLGHQLLCLALGGKTTKMPLGHRGANHPVQDLQTGMVEITSQNHGFCVLPETLPVNVEVTHISLFDKSNEGLRVIDKPAFSVQYHPESSPGPHDSHYLFGRFIEMIETSRKAA
ncbi:MAG: glutamine-hydrolyzing carbamoyl-phosphate synthase small subunit [Alphaproteobacteria bacterium]|nr:glutamine-hydrolyzing carbamoyl-phosphate synthase small subunit [Alphaproteobacteria bacterium]